MTLAIAGILLFSVAVPDLSGRVIDAAGAPVPEARVFLEPGLAGALQETRADAHGIFSFETLPPGSVGVFAHAPGHAFGGLHLNVSPGAQQPPITLQLQAPSTISGKIVDGRGKPVSGARITRLALQEQKVGIPLAKLRALGFTEPASGEDGSFVIGELPASGTIAVKVGHPLYAQEAVGDLAAGARNVKLTMYEGTLVEGMVLTRGEEQPVARASVVITSAQPPQDSALAFSNTQGEFSLRLKPGNYLYQATAIGWQSPGWIPFTVSGNAPIVRTRIVVGRAGALQGAVKDARTSQPIAGARLSLETNGHAAAVVRTGADGAYAFDAVEGDNILRLEAAPGYLPPASGPIQIALKEGEVKALPDMWLLPLPVWRVQILDANGQPAPGVLVSLLRPSQFGWRVSGPDGWLSIDVGNYPVESKIVGMAEHVHEPLGALFELDPANTEAARVQLLPLATMQAQAVDGTGKGLRGALAGAVFPGERPEDELLLWRMIAADNGAINWDSVVPGVPQVCIARAAASETGQSAPFNVAPAGAVNVGQVSVPGAAPAETLHGKSLAWSGLPVLCGTLPAARQLRNRPALVIYCQPAEAEAVIEALASPAFQSLVSGSDLALAVVVQGSVSCGQPPFPVLRGVAPGSATTYLTDRSGKVVLQTFGMPPLRALQRLSAARE